MKVLKKLSLVAAISAAAISAQAEMTSIEDSVMGDITGQAGVTIEMSTAVTIDRVTYTDAGSVQINDVAIGGSLAANAGTITTTDKAYAVGEIMNNGKKATQVYASGATFAVADQATNAFVATGTMSQTQTIDVDAAGNLIIGTSAGSVGLTVGDISLNGTGGTNSLVTDVYLAANLGAGTITVQNGTPGAATGAAATGAVSIDMTSSIRITDAGATVTLGSGSIGISGVTFDNGAGGNATMSQSIYAQSAIASGADDEAGTTLTSARSAGLVVESGAIAGTLTIGSIELGGTSIGSVAVSGINMAGSTMVIYGHN